MKFKPEDFYVCDEVVDGGECKKEHEISLSDKECADIANARLAEMLAEAPVVYWIQGKYERFLCLSDRLAQGADTHTGKLVDIQKLEDK